MILLQTLVDWLFDSPELTAVLALLLTILGHWQLRVGPDDDWIEAVRRDVFLAIDPIARRLGRPLIRRKGTLDYITSTLDASPDDVERALVAYGYTRNLISTRKYRLLRGGKDWAVGSWRHVESGSDWQHHVYLFYGHDTADRYFCDVYGHKEKRYDQADPEEHVSERQIHGDPDGHVELALSRFKIKHRRDDEWAGDR